MSLPSLIAGSKTSGQRASRGKEIASNGGNDTGSSSTRVANKIHYPLRSSNASRVRESGSTNQR